jgi:hypothetical protein
MSRGTIAPRATSQDISGMTPLGTMNCYGGYENSFERHVALRVEAAR